LDDTGQLWSAGVREGVQRGSRVHLTEFFGPVLGIMTAATLEVAIEIQNEVDYGLTAGLHSLDPDEVALWLDRVEAGNLYVNRGTTGAVVRRQPFGGWKKSAVGSGYKAGGPNYLVGLGGWVPAVHGPIDEAVDGPAARLLTAGTEALTATELDFLRRAFASDSRAWRTEFGVAKDVSGLTAERNVFRYRPVPVHVRLAEGGSTASLVRVLGAAATVGAPVDVSSGAAQTTEVTSVLTALGHTVTEQTDAAWLNDMARRAPARIRLIDGDTNALAERIGGRPDVAVHDRPVTEAGRLELLPFVREQTISITAHRFGTQNYLTDGII